MEVSPLFREWLWRQYDKAEVEVVDRQAIVGQQIIIPNRRLTTEEVTSNIARAEERNREFGGGKYKLYLRPDGADDLRGLVADVGFPFFGLDGDVEGLEAAGWASSSDEGGFEEISMGYAGTLGMIEITSSRSKLSRNPLRRWLALTEQLHNFLYSDVWAPSSELSPDQPLKMPTDAEIGDLARSTNATIGAHKSQGGQYVLATANVGKGDLELLRSHIVRLDRRPDAVARLEAQSLERH